MDLTGGNNSHAIVGFSHPKVLSALNKQMKKFTHIDYKGWTDENLIELSKLHSLYKLIVLSNGDKWFLDHLVKDCIKFEFDAVISVDDVGFFKPHPTVYLHASKQIQIEPEYILMVSSNRFDITGARSAGYQAALIDRYYLPQDESAFQPNIIVENFQQLSKQLAFSSDLIVDEES